MPLAVRAALGVQINDRGYVKVSAQMVFGRGFISCVIPYVLYLYVHQCYRCRRMSSMGKLKTEIYVDLLILEAQKYRCLYGAEDASHLLFLFFLLDLALWYRYDKTTNSSSSPEVLHKMKTKRSLLNTIQKRKCQYFGHIIRGDGVQRLLMEGRINGRRGRGRPRTMWTDNIKQGMDKNII